jgi:ATP-dependent exoDNAse (exonuclease V) beta subunit
VVDLVYRDPATGDLVIADYKSDRVGREAAAARALAYRRQGRVYAEALRAALGLPALPRFELWLLEAGRIETVALEGPGGPG